MRALAAAVALLAGLAPAAAQEAMGLAHARGTDRAAIAIAGPGREAAARAARDACGAGCATLAVLPRSSCVALALGRQRYGWSLHEFGREAAARSLALGYCNGGDATRRCAVAVVGCLPPAPAPAHYGSEAPLALARPADTIVLIYTHGSDLVTVPDPCEMDRLNAPYGVPDAIHALDGATVAGLRVAVDGFCTPTRVGRIDPATGRNLGKLAPRARELGERAAAYVARGVPARQIVVAGHSTGGWAALMAALERPDAIGAAIAFAPAAWNRASERTPEVEASRQQRYADLLAARRIEALVYGFAGDAFESDADLRALGAIPGVAFVAIGRDGPPGRTCVLEPHVRVRDLCFSETQVPRLRAFLAARAAGR